MRYFLVVGLGSMGKRRIRNLRSLGIENIIGFDIRDERAQEVTRDYSIETFNEINLVLESFDIEAFIISVPPDVHHKYIILALKYGIPSFVEASVLDTDLDQIILESKQKGILIAPSCTLFFHPAIKKIKEIIESKELGIISNFIYHSGQYLPDWHVYEKVSDYYVSRKETGGGREIVPFELSWITLLLGFPERVVGFYKKTIEIEGASTIDDTYNLLMDFGNNIFNLSVDVVSRFATRRLLINGASKQLYWDWNEDVIKVYDPDRSIWEIRNYAKLEAEAGYNKNITEQMYIDEMRSFIMALRNENNYPNNLEHDRMVLKLLYAVERSDLSNSIISFK
jgi:predicted dehydrogenase